MPPPRPKGFVNNAVVSTILHFSSTFVVLAITPYVLNRIGLEAYGLWALLNTVVRYSLLADVGIGPSVSKHAAQFIVAEDRFAIRAVNTIGTLYYALIAGVVLLIAQTAGPFLLSHLSLSPDLHASAPALLTAFVGSFLLNLTLWSSPSAALNGIGLFRVASAVNAIGNLLYVACVLAMLHAGWGVSALIDASYVQTTCSGILGIVLLWRILGCCPFVNPLHVPKALFGKVLGYGGWLQISTIAWLVISDAPAILVGYFVGVQAVGILDVGTRLARAVRAIAFNFMGALLPAVSSMQAQAGNEKVLLMLPRAARVIGFASFSVTGLLIASSPALLHFWLGTNFAHERMIIFVVSGLSLTYSIETLTHAAGTAAGGLGKPWLDVYYSVGYALSSLVLAVLLTPRFGLPGIVIASFIGVLCGSLAFFIASTKSQTIGFAYLFRDWLSRLSAATAAATIVTFLFDSYLARYAVARTALFVTLIGAGALYVATSAVVQRAVGFFGRADLEKLRTVLPARFSGLLDASITRELFAAP